MTDFVRPDFAKRVDALAQKRLVPAGATSKGMQLQALVDECRRAGAPLEGRRYVGFRDYPGAELIELLVLTAERVHPHLPRREGMRRLGRLAFPAFRGSIVGRVAFRAVGAVETFASIVRPKLDEVRAAWTLLPKAYAISGSVGGVEVVSVEESAVVLHFFGIYSFVDAWHVGIVEGAVEAFERIPDVRIRMLTETDADMRVRWTAKA